MAKPTKKKNPQEQLSKQKRVRETAASRRRKAKRNRILISVAVAIPAAVLIFFMVKPSEPLKGSPATTGPEGTIQYSAADLPREHVTGNVDYRLKPPVGGKHDAVWQNCGFYSSSLNNENAVHVLEHGAVWVTYRNSVPADQVDKLRALAQGKTHLLVSRDDDLPTPIVASAWGYQLKVDNADDPKLAQFVETFMNGPQTPEPGAKCSGGIGTPS